MNKAKYYLDSAGRRFSGKTVIISLKDGLIPFSNSKELMSSIKPNDQFFTIENGNHHNLNEFPFMQENLKHILTR